MSDDSKEKTEEAPGVEMVEIKVDGKAFQAPKGKNLLLALLEDAGVDISYFCYHPELSIAACCRQCMVKVGGRMMPSCQGSVAPDMEIESETEDVRAIRQQMLEYTLLNHPVDCVMCDKAGECTLQRHYMDFDGEASLVNHQKVEKPKKVDLGPDVILDAERCIMCSRCIRFCAEVAKQPQLVFEYRGDHKSLTVAPGHELDNPYCLNTVDICPVGALTDKDFRFKIRVWELFATRTVCNGCARGCPTEIHHRDGVAYRMVPPKRWDMNLNWMCNYGRRTYKRLSTDRLSAPLVGSAKVEFEEGIKAAADLCRDLLEDKEALGVVIGAEVTNESALAAAHFAFDLLGTENVYLADRPDDGQGDEILRRDDPNPNRAGIMACGRGKLKTVEELATALSENKLKALYVIGDRLQLSDEMLSQMSGVKLVVQACHSSRLTSKAQVVLPASKWSELDGTITNFEGKVQRLRPAVEPPGLARPHWDLLARVAAALELSFAPASPTAKALFDKLKGIEAFGQASWGERIPTMLLRFSGRRG